MLIKLVFQMLRRDTTILWVLYERENYHKAIIMIIEMKIPNVLIDLMTLIAN